MNPSTNGEKFPINRRFPFAHTFSIVARDPESGEMGAAVQSHWFSVGSVVPWGEAGVGIVVTQSIVEPSYGPLGLELMYAKKSPQTVLYSLLAPDTGREFRQLAMLDDLGRVAAYTGEKCIAEAGHTTGEQFSVQANMMANREVWPAMAEAYRSAKGSLAERMLSALDAGQAAGGDIRGKQSACILVVKGTASKRPWEDTVMDLRVEDHPEPLAELRRLVKIRQAYALMDQGDRWLESKQTEKAMDAYRAAAAMQPQIEELPFWHAVTLADSGQLDEALPLFKEVFTKNRNWATLVQRLPQSGLLRDDPEMMRRILEQAGNAAAG